MKVIHKNQVVELKITSFTKNGNGLGVFELPNGMSVQVEVPFTMPGDQVQAKLLRKYGGIYKGKLDTIISPAPERIAPRCVHFSVCGGCRFQHVPYSLELKQKEDYVRHCFDGLLTPESIFHPIMESHQLNHYRNKAEYSFSSSLTGDKYLGLVMDSNRGKVFNISECFLTNPWFMTVVKAVRQWWSGTDLEAFQRHMSSGTLRTLTIREGQRTGDRMVILTVSGNPTHELKQQQINSFIACVREAIGPLPPSNHLSIYLRIQTNCHRMPTSVYEMCIYGQDHIREMVMLYLDNSAQATPLSFKIYPSTFFHHNVYQAESLYSNTFKLAQIPSGSTLYHLYCGTGTLGLYFANQAKEVIGVELSPEVASQATLNAKLNGFTNFNVISGAVRHVLAEVFEQKLPLPDALLLSPPRTGIEPKALINIRNLSAKKIIYVSSNPFIQAKDVSELLKHGYRIESIQPADHFPFTALVQNVVILKSQ